MSGYLTYQIWLTTPNREHVIDGPMEMHAGSRSRDRKSAVHSACRYFHKKGFKSPFHFYTRNQDDRGQWQVRYFTANMNEPTWQILDE